jgi:hypothetical protein
MATDTSLRSIHAMTWALVLTSGAGMSRCTPSTWLMARVNRRVMPSSSCAVMPVGSTAMPPLAPPNGSSMSAVFHVMSDARARTSSRSAEGW